MPADILIDTNAIVLEGGDVTVEQDLAVQGNLAVQSQLTVDGDAALASKLTVEPDSGFDAIEVRTGGSLRLKVRSSGELYLYHPNGGIRVANSSGATRFLLSSNGTSTFYEDLNLVSGADIKLDSQFLAARLDAIEQRLTNGGL